MLIGKPKRNAAEGVIENNRWLDQNDARDFVGSGFRALLSAAGQNARTLLGHVSTSLHLFSQARLPNPISLVTTPQQRLSSRMDVNSAAVETVEEAPPLDPAPRKAGSYYRPELDALRFFAFFSVFVGHGPRLNYGPSSPMWKQLVGSAYERISYAGLYGLPLFFFLSSFLITELLLREREKTGSVHIKAFYIRRVLRIWPLYFVGVLGAIALSIAFPHHYGLTHREIAYLILFVGYLGGSFHFNPFGILWSVSVEELFYLAWPWVANRGKQVILYLALLCLPISLITCFVVTPQEWFNPVCHFIFFGTGALAALKLHQRAWNMSNVRRILMFAAGFVAVVSAPLFYWHGGRWACALSFLVVDLGVVLGFLSIFQLSPDRIPKWIIYLGQISYGLYVFHLACLHLVSRAIIPHTRVAASPFLSFLATAALSLALTISLAFLSYRYLELPFLRLKKRFEFIRSRSVSA